MSDPLGSAVSGRRVIVRTLDIGGGALLAAAVLWPFVLGLPWIAAVAMAVVAIGGWLVSDRLTALGWRTRAGGQR